MKVNKKSWQSQQKDVDNDGKGDYNVPIANKKTTKQRKRGDKIMRRKKNKTVWAYLDGKKLVDVVQAALDNNMMVSDMKKKLIEENPGHEVTFKAI